MNDGFSLEALRKYPDLRSAFDAELQGLKQRNTCGSCSGEISTLIAKYADLIQRRIKAAAGK